MLQSDWDSLGPEDKHGFRSQPTSILLQIHPGGSSSSEFPDWLRVPPIEQLLTHPQKCISYQLYIRRATEGRCQYGAAMLCATLLYEY